MKRGATDRLASAVVLSLTGALLAVLAGMAEVALFVAPWMVLCALGLTRGRTSVTQVELEVDRDRLLVGDTVELTVRLRTDDLQRVRVTPSPSRWFHASSDKTDGVGARAMEVDIVVALAGPTADRSEDVRFELTADHWGAHDLGRIVLDVTEPYGLFRTSGAVSARRNVRVHPTPTQLTELLTPWHVRRVSGTHRSRESARGVEYADIRRFAAGDSVRDINWRASARSTDLLVSQRHPDRASDVILLVDSFVESGHDVRAVFGLVVEAAVALAESHLGATDRVGLIEFGGLVRWVTPGTGRVQLQRLTDALLSTGLYANAADKELPILPARTLPPRSFVIAFSPLLDQRFVDAVFTARGRGHDVAVVECLPPVSLGSEIADTERLARRIWAAERAMVRDHMAEQGIAVAPWDGTEHIDITLGRLLARRRRAVRIGGGR